MILLFLVLFAISVWGIKCSRSYADYMSPHTSNAIKGIFAVIILYSHMRGYIQLDDNVLDKGYRFVLDWIGQLMVAIFLFYSGYGIMESIKRKPQYADTFFKKRILKTILHFDVAVVLYLALQTILGESFALSTYLLCWIGWDSVGNSSWFIFDIIALYCITWPVLYFSKLKQYQMGGAILLLTGILWYILHKLRTDDYWWYDTLLTYPAGMFYSTYKTRIDQALFNGRNYWILAIPMLLIFSVWKVFIHNDIFGICACLFCVLIVICSVKVKIDNRVLQWLGDHAFAIYIMQRWPMILFTYYGLNTNKWFFVSLAIPSVLIVSSIYNKLLNKMDKRLL